MQPPKVHIFIEVPSEKTVVVAVDSCTTVEDVKATVSDVLGIPPGQQRLVFGGKQLEDGKLLVMSGYGIREDSTGYMLQRTLGGTATDEKITELMTLTRLAHAEIRKEMHRLREQNGALQEQNGALAARARELEAAGAKVDHDIMDALKARRSDILHSDP